MGACLTPIILKQHDNIKVPCSKCPECRARRISGWSFRLMQEYKRCKTAHFLTLTYDTTHVPITHSGYMGLSKRDVQLFIKRLRKAHVQQDCYNRTIKYYACGEYGGKTKRPHYHLIMFNAKLELIQPAWDLGQIHYGEVNEASVGYTLKYMCKPSQIPLHRNDDRQKEFSLMSKGLGSGYLTKAMVTWHNSDKLERMYCNIEDGKKIAMPRYYKNKIYTEFDRIMTGQHQLKKMLEKQAEHIKKHGIERYEQIMEEGKQSAFNRQKVTQTKRNKI